MPKRKVEVILSAQLVILRSQGQPDMSYWTAEGASIRLHELRQMPGVPNLHRAQQLVDEGRLLPDGYFGGTVPLFSDATIQALAGSLRRWRRKAVPDAETAEASDQPELD